MHCSWDLQPLYLEIYIYIYIYILKIGPMALFTYLKIILL